ncbi:MAG: polysaccharide biosynthesis C-terminal domain-containing protein, partial [Oscillospiraceae bacterium]
LFILLCISNINILYTQLDKIFLGTFVSKIANTEYTLPANITNMIGVMLISLIVVSIPRLSYYVSHGMERDYLALLNKSSRAFFLVLCPTCIGLCCLSYEAMYLYTKGAYAYAYPVLQIFALRFLISSLYSIFTNQILYIRGKEHAMIRILLVGGVLNVIFDVGLLAIGKLTPVSAIVSTAIAETIMLSIMYWYIRKKVKVPFKLFAFKNMKYLYFSLPFFAITYFIRQLELGVLLNCAIIIPLCGLTYLTILFVTKDDMLFYFINKIKAKITRK